MEPEPEPEPCLFENTIKEVCNCNRNHLFWVAVVVSSFSAFNRLAGHLKRSVCMTVFWILNLTASVLAAKLGDTKELEDFIANLDKTLESKC